MKWIAFFCALVVLSMACSRSTPSARQQKLQQWKAENGKVKVLSTTAMIDDLARQVGGVHVDCHTLIIGELDPHSYQLVKGDDEVLAYSQLIFYNGLGLEHGPSLKAYLEAQPKAVSLGSYVMGQNPHRILAYNGQTDPHIWMDVALWSQTVPCIVAALSKRDPEHAPAYKENGELLMQQLAQVHEELRSSLQNIPENKRYLVTSHDAFNYFARAYLATDAEKGSGEWEKRFKAPEGLAPDSQLSTLDVQHILDHIRQYRIEVLFAESNVSKDSIRKIVDAGKKSGLKVVIAQNSLYADTMGGPGSDGDTYVKMIRHNAALIAQELVGHPSHE